MTYLQSQTELLFEQLPKELQTLFRILRLSGHEVYINEETLHLELTVEDDYMIEISEKLQLEVWMPINSAAYTRVDNQHFYSEQDCIDYIEAVI